MGSTEREFSLRHTKMPVFVAVVETGGSPPQIASVHMTLHSVRLFSPLTEDRGRDEDARKAVEANVPALEVTMAVFTTWFDQPMYINGNQSRPIMFAGPAELQSAAMLRCSQKRSFFSDTSPPLITLPSGTNSWFLSPSQLQREHRRMLNIFQRHHRREKRGRRAQATVSDILDTASRRVGRFLEGQLGIEWLKEPNVFRSMLLLEVRGRSGEVFHTSIDPERVTAECRMGFPSVPEQILTAELHEGTWDRPRRTQHIWSLTSSHPRSLKHPKAAITNFHGETPVVPRQQTKDDSRNADIEGAPIAKHRTESFVVHDIVTSLDSSNPGGHSFYTPPRFNYISAIEEAAHSHASSETLMSALEGGPMDILSPNTFINPVVEAMLAQAVPRLLQDYEPFLKPTISNAVVGDMVGSGEEGPKPNVPTFSAETLAETTAQKMELVESTAAQTKEAAAEAEQEGKDQLEEAQATAKAMADEKTEASKAEALKKSRDQKIEMAENNGARLLLMETSRSRRQTALAELSLQGTTKSEVGQKAAADLASKALVSHYQTLSRNGMEQASKHASNARRFEIVAAQAQEEYRNFLSRADKTQKRINSGWWPEYRLLSIEQAGAQQAMEASLRASEAAKASREAATALLKASAAQGNLTRKLAKRHRDRDISQPFDENVSDLVIDVPSSYESSISALLELDTGVSVGSEESLEIMNSVVEASREMHLRGRATHRIEADQWMELGEKTPKKALGYVQKTLTQTLSHSLTTEMSAIITTKLTRALNEMITGLLSDSLISVVPDRITRQISHALAPSTGVSVAYVASVVILRMLPLYLSASLENVLTNTLTRGLSHSLGATLTHTLRHDAKSEYFCYYCRIHKKFCNRCNFDPATDSRASHYLERDTSYYSDYYAMFYTGNPNPRPAGLEYVMRQAPAKVVSSKEREWKNGVQ